MKTLSHLWNVLFLIVPSPLHATGVFFRARGRALARETCEASVLPFVTSRALAHSALGSQCGFGHLIRTSAVFLPAYTLVLNSRVLPKRSKFLEEARQGQTLVINGGCFLFPLVVLKLRDVHCKDLPQRHAIKASV